MSSRSNSADSSDAVRRGSPRALLGLPIALLALGLVVPAAGANLPSPARQTVVGAAAAEARCTQIPVPTKGVKRPPQGGAYSYGPYKERVVRLSNVAVHYVESGRDAPPARDTSPRNGTPDYVDALGRAASDALAFYTDASAPKGSDRVFAAFRKPPCDSAGPNNRPDIYVKRILNGYGRSLRPAQGAGGAFVLVSNNLERPSKNAARRYGIVRWTAAHELFHLVQYAYAPRGMPRWIAEGTAQAAAVYWAGLLASNPYRDELFAVEKQWWKKPWEPFYAADLYCSRCYGGASFWVEDFFSGSDEAGDPGLVHQLFEALGSSNPSPLGTREFYPLYKDWSLRLLRESSTPTELAFLEASPPEMLANWYQGTKCQTWFTGTDTSRWAWEPDEPPMFTTITPTPTPQALSRQVQGFSCQYIEVNIPRDAVGLGLLWEFQGVDPLRAPLVVIGLGGHATSTITTAFNSMYDSTMGFGETGKLRESLVIDLRKPGLAGGRAVLFISSALDFPVNYRLGHVVVRAEDVEGGG